MIEHISAWKNAYPKYSRQNSDFIPNNLGYKQNY